MDQELADAAYHMGQSW